MSKASSMKNGVLGLIMKYVIIDYNEFTREFSRQDKKHSIDYRHHIRTDRSNNRQDIPQRHRIKKLERRGETMERNTEEIQKEFEALAKPLIKFLNDNFNPHCSIIIDTMSAEVLCGEMAFSTEEFIND